VESKGSTAALVYAEVVDVTDVRSAALERLDVFVGEWTLEARFPGEQPMPAPARTRFEWALDRQFLFQRTEIPVSEAPDSLTIVSVGSDGGYTQHYYDSRGVVRLYAMRLVDRTWTLTRESPDFSPLEFRQRFTGTFSDDNNLIEGTWETGLGDTSWVPDFALTYRRMS
jgi:hypothetical protein